jgi:hypothetical protein
LSSILRALKKLESEPRHRDETQPLDSKFVPLADTSPQRTPKTLIMMIIGGGLVCGLVILAGWWLFSEKLGPDPVVPQKISRQAIEPAEMVPVKKQEAAVPQSSDVAVEAAQPAADIPAPPPKIADQSPVPAPVNIVPPPVQAVAKEAVMPVAEPASPGQEITEQVPADEEAVAGTRGAPEVATRAQTPEIPALKDPEIKLQAITWSKDPQRRIVVINNRILRQGDVVLGYRIDTINQDDIVLSEAGKKWELVFRIK